VDLDLQARQLQVLAEGLMDAFVLSFFEAKREEGKRSAEWMARQDRKIDGRWGRLTRWLRRGRVRMRSTWLGRN
jgi:glutathione S-transferase